MLLHFLKLINSLLSLMFHVKRLVCKGFRSHRFSTKHLFYFLVFFLSVYFFARSASIEAEAEEKLNITRVNLGGVDLKEIREGVYSGTVGSAPNLKLSIFSDDFKSMTDYNLSLTMAFSYPQTVGSQINITPVYDTLHGGTTYLAEIGKVSGNGNLYTYRTKDYYDSNQPHVPPFTHGGYNSIFGSSQSSQTVTADLTYYFNTNDTVRSIGLYMETGGPGSLSTFPTSSRQVTITIDYLTAPEKAMIENAETTKNIFEWLQDGLVKLLVPTSDGFQEMVLDVNSRLQTQSGILTMPLNFVSQCAANFLSALSGSISASVHLPEFKIEMNGNTSVLWSEQDFNLNSGVVQHLFNNSNFVLLVQCGTAFFILRALFKTASDVTLGLLDIRDIEQATEEKEE